MYTYVSKDTFYVVKLDNIIYIGFFKK